MADVLLREARKGIEIIRSGRKFSGSIYDTSRSLVVRIPASVSVTTKWSNLQVVCYGTDAPLYGVREALVREGYEYEVTKPSQIISMRAAWSIEITVK